MPINNICLIIPSLRHGGAERVITVLANEWVRDPQNQVNIILLTKQERYYKLDPRVNIIEPARFSGKSFFSKLFYIFFVIIYLRKNAKMIDPTSILSFCERYNNIVLLALLGTNLSVFVSDRNNPNNHLGHIHEFLRKILYKRAKGIIAQTEIAKDIIYKKTGNTNIQAIPNPLREIVKHNRVIKKNIIINVGRFETQKNQKELIEIFYKLKSNFGWKLRLIGIGSLESDLRKLIDKYNIGHQVELLGFKDDIDAYLQESKIFAFTSLYEGFPNSLSEAMANGLAPIAYDCPTGPSELIINLENGFLVNLKDKDDFIDKLQTLIDNESLRNTFSEQAQKVSTTFSSSTISNIYLKFITK